jgi:hypothetical protein
MLPPLPLTDPDVQISRFLYLSHAVPGEVMARWHAEWSVAKRRVPPRATARIALSFLDRADSPGATTRILRRKQLRAPEPDMCPGENGRN